MKTILVIGFGPGISASVAKKFGGEGFSVAVVSRDAERQSSGVEALRGAGIEISFFQADAAQPESVRDVVSQVRAHYGSINVVHWNAYGGEPRDLLAADAASVRGSFDIAIVGLLAAVQEALPDLKEAGDGAVLVTNGSAGELKPAMDRFVVGRNAMGLRLMGTALANAAKDKLVGMLGERLESDGVHVAQVTIDGTVKGTAWDSPDSIDPNDVASTFWDLYQKRDTRRVRLSSSDGGWVDQQSVPAR